MLCGDVLYLYLIGIDFFELLQDLWFDELCEFWQVNLEFELEMLYCVEYFVGEVFVVVDVGCDGFSLECLQVLLVQLDELVWVICDFVVLCYKEGYEKGIYDYDVVVILVCLLLLCESVGLLCYVFLVWVFVSLFWSCWCEEWEVVGWFEWVCSSCSIQQMFGCDDGLFVFCGEVVVVMCVLFVEQFIVLDLQYIDEVVEYLVWELFVECFEFIFSKYVW